MAIQVNLDALIPREDFEVITGGGDAPEDQSIKISDLEGSAFFFGALRKPDFQRETAEWDPSRVVGLIRTFIDGELIPGVILWRHKELLFVIDGSHRLSALIAWVQDDYGDGPRSQAFFNHTIPEEQLRIARRTRELAEKAFGSYRSHRDAIANPENYGPDIVARARRFGSLALSLQWVRGDSVRAEDSFIRINQRAAVITPQELELLKNRSKPHTIAARAIIRRGTGYKYWSSFGDQEQREIQAIATDLHRLIFDPALTYPITSLDLPAGGAVYSSTALRMIYDFVTLAVGVASQDDDKQGERTIQYLKRCRKVMRLLLSKDPSSLGLHPAVYFYSWTGKQQPILFLTITSLIVDWERAGRLPEFTELRRGLEGFLFTNRPLLNQVIRKFGTKDSGGKHLRRFYDSVIDQLNRNLEEGKMLEELQKDFPYLQPEEIPYGGVTPTRFSTQVKSGLTMRNLLQSAPKCPICGGFVPTQAVSIDHVQREQDGGVSNASNAQITHPYCNTGYKEMQVARAKAGTPKTITERP